MSCCCATSPKKSYPVVNSVLGFRIPFDDLYWVISFTMSAGVSTRRPPATLGGYRSVASHGMGWNE